VTVITPPMIGVEEHPARVTVVVPLAVAEVHVASTPANEIRDATSSKPVDRILMLLVVTRLAWWLTWTDRLVPGAA
jgi:hypothetical protein